MKPSENASVLTAQIELVRIFRNVTYSVIYTTYLFWVVTLFILGNWMAGLLGLFLIAAIHPIRYFLNESERTMSNLYSRQQLDSEQISTQATRTPQQTVDLAQQTAEIVRYQQVLSLLLRLALYLCDVSYIVIGWYVMPFWWALGAAIGIMVVEILQEVSVRIDRKVTTLVYARNELSVSARNKAASLNWTDD